MRGRPRSVSRVNKILLIATREIGDVLLTTPLIHSLRQAYPQATIDVVAFQHKAGILIGNPDCSNIITVPERPTRREYSHILKQLWRRYDLAIATLPGDRPLFYTWLAAPKRITVVPPPQWQNAWKRAISQAWIELDDANTHAVVQNLRLADLLDIPRHYPVIVPSLPGDDDALEQVVPFRWQDEPYAVLHLLPRWRYKRWHLAGWSALAEYLDKLGLRLIVTGGGGEAEIRYLRDALSDLPTHVLNLAGKLSFSALGRLLRSAQIYVGPDTVVTHLAAATGVATVALYGPSNPLRWAPWPQTYASDSTPFRQRGNQRVGNVLLLQGPGACVPCQQEGCKRHRESYSRCLDELSAGQVIGELRGAFGL